jgi:hypothetical protein
MALHSLSAAAKRVLPRWIWSPARKLLTGLLTPIRFSLYTGHFRSSILSAAVDRHGNPIPWYTFPAIDFIDTKDFSSKLVLEFGSGQSTLWWAKRCKRVVSFESDPKWFAYVQSVLPDNAKLLLIADDLNGLQDHLQGSKFDVIVIDGLDRLKAAICSIELLESEGAILVDNSDVSWGAEATKEYPILQLMRSSGFSRIDFYGYAPGVVMQHCTSLFFKGGSFIIRGDENVVRNKLPGG